MKKNFTMIEQTETEIEVEIEVTDDMSNEDIINAINEAASDAKVKNPFVGESSVIDVSYYDHCGHILE